MRRSYKIAVWNANGLWQHRKEVEMFLNFNNIDVFLISETHFTERNYFSIFNYNTYKTLHPDGTAHGGTAILIRKQIKHYELPQFKSPHIQATNVCITDWNGDLTVSAVYCPPRHNIRRNDFIEFFNTLGPRFIAGGDFNAKNQAWGSRLNTPRGRELLHTVRSKHYATFSTGEPTYWPTDGNRVPDLLDFIIVNGISQNYVAVQSSQDLSSDHSPIIATISTSVLLFDKPFRFSNFNTHWCNFKSMINTEMSLGVPLQTAEDIEDTIEYFTRVIQKAAWQSTPLERAKTRSATYPDEIRNKVIEKRRLRRVWQNTHHPHDKTRYNQCSRRLKEMIKNYKEETLQEYLYGLSPTADTDYSLWKATRNLEKSCQAFPPVKKSDGTWARSDREKVALFANHLKDRFQPHDINGDLNFEADILRSAAIIPPQLGPVERVTPSEVKRVVLGLNPRKAPGYDLITGKILQELPRKGIIMLTMIINAVLRTGFYPGQWKMAKVIMILKPGKPEHELSSYRPISLLTIMSKVFEKLFLQRLQHRIYEDNLVPDHQFGFRSHHSTVEQVHRITKVIRNSLEERKYCSAVFLDVSQAFDRVWHPGLLYKLKNVFQPSQYRVLRSYLENRRFFVQVRNETSELVQINAGVPQGSVLGPVLYVLFTADLPTSDNVTTATFADDTAILATASDPACAANKVQQVLNNIETWLKKWKVRINEDKSTHVTFTMRPGMCPNVTLYGRIIPQASEVKYLGIHLDRRLTWKRHIQMKRKQLNIKFRRMYWLLGRTSSLSTENKLLLYKSILKPVWTYGVQLWGTAANSNVEILQRFQSKTLRTILNAPWYITNDMIHRDTGIKTVREVISDSSGKYLQRLDNHVNHLAINLLDNSDSIIRLKRSTILDLPTRFV